MGGNARSDSEAAMSTSPSHVCGDHLETVERVRDFPIHGTTVSIREELYRCAMCGEEEYSFEQAVAAERRASELYHEQNVSFSLTRSRRFGGEWCSGGVGDGALSG
jgi:hypothetical protein